MNITDSEIQKTKKSKVRKLTSLSEETGHILGIISSLLTNLASETNPRVRLLLKFVEEEYEKCDKLLELREHALNRLKAADKAIATEKQVRCRRFPCEEDVT